MLVCRSGGGVNILLYWTVAVTLETSVSRAHVIPYCHLRLPKLYVVSSGPGRCDTGQHETRVLLSGQLKAEQGHPKWHWTVDNWIRPYMSCESGASPLKIVQILVGREEQDAHWGLLKGNYAVLQLRLLWVFSF